MQQIVLNILSLVTQVVVGLLENRVKRLQSSGQLTTSTVSAAAFRRMKAADSATTRAINTVKATVRSP